MLFFRSLKSIVSLAIFIATSCLCAQDGSSDAFLRLQSSSVGTHALVGLPLATADFDHDGHPDGALLLGDRSNFRIEVHLRSQQVRDFTFISNLSDLSIFALDVNRDGSPDLVVQSAFSHRRLFVWLNDGRGSFHAEAITDYPDDTPSDSLGVQIGEPGKNDRALLGSSKLRSGHLAGWISRQTGSPETPVVREHVWNFLRLHASPNLVRGSPVFPAL